MDGDMTKVMCPDCETLYKPGERHGCARLNPPNPKQRYGDLKVPLGLVPSSAKIYMALALAEGTEKYGFFNWRDKAVEAMTYIHALERHVSAWVDGEDADPTSGKPHLGHAMACLAILVDATEVGNLIDNRPLSAPTGELLGEFAAGYVVNDEPDNDGLVMEKIIEAKGILAEAKGVLAKSMRIIAEEGGRTVVGPIEAFLGDDPTYRRRWTPEENPHIGSSFDDFMAEIMETEERQNAAFGEGDETPMPTGDDAHARAGVPNGMYKALHSEWIGMTNAACPLDGRNCDHEHPAPKWDAEMKFPCDCTIPGRCKIENGWTVGLRTFCCQAEEGKY